MYQNALKNALKRTLFKKALLCAILFMLCGSGYQADAQNRKSLIEHCLNILQQYDSAGHSIFQRVLQAPEDYIICESKVSIMTSANLDEYLEGNTLEDLIYDLPTLVHEFSHAYTGNPYPYMLKHEICDVHKEYYLYFLTPQQEFFVEITQTFPSKSLYKYIRQNGGITFRTSSYIDGNTSTQTHGIYGLLDEMNAYRLGAQTVLQLPAYFVDSGEKYEKWLINYLAHSQSGMIAYYEFRFFILSYLIYAKTHQASIFEDIVANKPFVKAFLEIEESFRKTVKDYRTLCRTIIAKAQKQNSLFVITASGIFYDKVGTPLLENNEDYVKLQQEMKKPEYARMMHSLKKAIQ
ncbi:MAG: hypothetical protein KatS3mg031_1622 [Chitinophagales bacterium]|nr:MAG: hypothetical protein KatS3mg031_1622 [Chitinophagales bacterium]